MRILSAIMALLLMTGMAMAQAAANQTTPPAPSTPAPSGQMPAATSPTPKQPQAKTKEEFEAYRAGAALTDPDQVLAAADAFAQKFPTSELKELLYVQAMNMFQQQNKADKEIEAGRKAIAVDPTDPIPLIHVASALVEVTRENDLDKDQRYAEAAKDAQAAIDNIDTGLHVPPNVTPEQVTSVKNNIVSTAYETLGVIQMNKQDFAGAESDFKKAIDASKSQPAARMYLRLSVAQDNQKKYSEALDSANKALQYSQEGTVEKNLAKQQQARLEKLAPSGSPASTPPAGSVPPQATPGSTPPPTAAQQPH